MIGSTDKKGIGLAIRSGTKWLAATSVGIQILQFSFGVVLARLLVPADFGLLVTVQVFTGLVGFIAGGGMGQALVQAKDVEKHHFVVIFTLQFAIGVLIYASFFFIAPWFAEFFGIPIYKDLLRVSAITFVLRPFANIPNTLLTRAMRFKAQAINSLVSTCVGGSTSIGLAILDFGVWALVIGGIVGGFTSAIIIIAVTRWRPGFAYDAATAKRLGAYGFKVSANDIADYLRRETPNFIISRLAGPATVGIYNKADSLAMLPIRFVAFPLYQPMVSALSRAQENRDQSRYMYYRALTLVTVYAVPFAVGLWWIAEPFVRVVYGQKWVASVGPLQILLLGAVFHCIGNQSGAVVAAQDRLGRELFIHLESSIFLAVGCVLAVGHGIALVAWVVLAAHIYTNLRVAYLAIISIGASVRGAFRSLRPALLLNCILAASLAGAHWLCFGALEATHPILYLVGMGSLGATIYLSLFLYLPLKELSSEALRWKRALYLIR